MAVDNSISSMNIHHLNQSVLYVKDYAHKARNARITAIALGMIALFLFASSFVLFGMGTLSPTFLMGLGLFPYLGGTLLSFIAFGIVIGMLVFSVIFAVRSCQKDHWQAVWQRSQSQIS